MEKSMLSRLNGDKVIWTVVFLLSLISIALIYSSSSSLAYKEKTTNFAFLIKKMDKPWFYHIPAYGNGQDCHSALSCKGS